MMRRSRANTARDNAAAAQGTANGAAALAASAHEAIGATNSAITAGLAALTSAFLPGDQQLIGINQRLDVLNSTQNNAAVSLSTILAGILTGNTAQGSSNDLLSQILAQLGVGNTTTASSGAALAGILSQLGTGSASSDALLTTIRGLLTTTYGQGVPRSAADVLEAIRGEVALSQGTFGRIVSQPSNLDDVPANAPHFNPYFDYFVHTRDPWVAEQVGRTTQAINDMKDEQRQGLELLLECDGLARDAAVLPDRCTNLSDLSDDLDEISEKLDRLDRIIEIEECEAGQTTVQGLRDCEGPVVSGASCGARHFPKMKVLTLLDRITHRLVVRRPLVRR